MAIWKTVNKFIKYFDTEGVYTLKHSRAIITKKLLSFFE